MSYSKDFRECVIENINTGKTWSAVISTFKISRATLSSWIKQYKEEGEVKVKQTRNVLPRKVDPMKLTALITNSPDSTLEELAVEFDTYPSVIDYHLRKMKITRKKNNSISRKKRGKKATI